MINKTKMTMTKEEFVAKFSQRHPEADANAGDDALFAAIDKEIDELFRDIDTCRAREKAVSDMFATDPRSGVFLSNWRDGADPVVEMVRQFGPELREALDNPALQQKLAEANNEYLGRVAMERTLGEEFRANIVKSLEMLDAKSERENISDADLESAWEWLRRIADNGLRGIVTEEAIDMALKAIRHDEDVAVARRTGEIDGRNTAIEVHLRENRASDGTVAPSGGLSVRRRPKFPLRE